jgi:hypothetical protein
MVRTPTALLSPIATSSVSFSIPDKVRKTPEGWFTIDDAKGAKGQIVSVSARAVLVKFVKFRYLILVHYFTSREGAAKLTAVLEKFRSAENGGGVNPSEDEDGEDKE